MGPRRLTKPITAVELTKWMDLVVEVVGESVVKIDGEGKCVVRARVNVMVRRMVRLIDVSEGMGEGEKDVKG